jgi:hypothetical protein
MKALEVLFTTDVGLMRVAVLAIILGMGAFYTWYFIHHMHEDEARKRAAGSGPT